MSLNPGKYAGRPPHSLYVPAYYSHVYNLRNDGGSALISNVRSVHLYYITLITICTMRGAAGWVRWAPGHGPPKILVGWATMHLAPPIIGLRVRSFSGKLANFVSPDVRL